MRKLLQSARRHAEARVILEEAAAELGEKAFRAVELMVEGLAPPEEPAARKPLTITCPEKVLRVAMWFSSFKRCSDPVTGVGTGRHVGGTAGYP